MEVLKFLDAYLLYVSAASAGKCHGVSSVVVRRHRGHAVIFVHVKRKSFDGFCTSERLVEVLAAEIVIYLQGLLCKGTHRKTKQLENIQ